MLLFVTKTPTSGCCLWDAGHCWDVAGGGVPDRTATAARSCRMVTDAMAETPAFDITSRKASRDPDCRRRMSGASPPSMSFSSAPSPRSGAKGPGTPLRLAAVTPRNGGLSERIDAGNASGVLLPFATSILWVCLSWFPELVVRARTGRAAIGRGSTGTTLTVDCCAPLGGREGLAGRCGLGERLRCDCPPRWGLGGLDATFPDEVGIEPPRFGLGGRGWVGTSAPR